MDEVAAFEELCGSHGGMGGTQNHPFILYPSDLAHPSQQIVGAENVHLQFTRWLVDLGHTAYADLPEHPHRLASSLKSQLSTIQSEATRSSTPPSPTSQADQPYPG